MPTVCESIHLSCSTSLERQQIVRYCSLSLINVNVLAHLFSEQVNVELDDTIS